MQKISFEMLWQSYPLFLDDIGFVGIGLLLLSIVQKKHINMLSLKIAKAI
jgi:hypothetical protein